MFNFSQYNDTEMLYFLGTGLFLGALLIVLLYLLRLYKRIKAPSVKGDKHGRDNPRVVPTDNDKV